jgi:hypothetical protein
VSNRAHLHFIVQQNLYCGEDPEIERSLSDQERCLLSLDPLVVYVTAWNLSASVVLVNQNYGGDHGSQQSADYRASSQQ